ncbi:hypothetical protein [Foetidibacter luteolus]|uniref:hypothetical protein n=1 Tax=Foetidibacter luteolus TaxID=2608880 RepID=UPI00129BFFD4|nr:hypothetical protein [Foetidibacter luteolus]
MFTNYLKTAWRSVLKNKKYSLSNIVGLSAGLTCFTLITLWVTDEVSYDKFSKNFGRIVLLTSTTRTETGIIASAVSGAPMAEALRHDYPEVENTVRMRMREEIITHRNQQVLQPAILLILFKVFHILSQKPAWVCRSLSNNTYI